MDEFSYLCVREDSSLVMLGLDRHVIFTDE